MSANLWTAFEAAAATGGALCARGGDPDRWIAEEWSAAGVSIDTRSLSPGEMFVALTDARDGHDFVVNAFERGAAAALVARAPKNAPEGAPLLVVGDTLEGLKDLARAARQRNFGKRIAVTGSVGKTSTKEMLRAAFAAAGRVHASDKSFNNHWGVPLTLARMPTGADYSVFEIGMNHAGEITPLTRLVRPHVAVITTIGEAHIENLGTRENIARAKAEIFLGLEKGATAVLPIDNDYFKLLAELAEAAMVARVVTFGEAKGADIRLDHYTMRDDGGAVSASVFGEPFEFSLAAPGKHQAMNALAVLGAARALGVSAAKAASGLKGLSAAQGRGAQTRVTLKSGGEIVILDESYNANPTSMAAAIALLGQLQPKGQGRRIAVLGDMLELGERAPALHAGLSEALVAAGIDRLYVAGALMRNLWDKTPEGVRGAAVENAKALAPLVLADARAGDIVMVKGSNASKVSEIVTALKGAAA
ncbi:MAG TPA: UDP-N-acetylmuramoylalanyl-D-glutamyl-2, 6-diaminopimelate--D-alanyl-D-alanine ligase [Parvularcula sp.]|nr:UDP-N-acetylmuramoylalanyl-D-glutamyl-2, 6-diaminopimelate--D-alanyl-D-alanine ligase [Parvularcula sp.]